MLLGTFISLGFVCTKSDAAATAAPTVKEKKAKDKKEQKKKLNRYD